MAFIVTLPTDSPETEGYYCIVDKERYYTTYWTGKEWRYYKNVPERSAIQFDCWLRPLDLSGILGKSWEGGANSMKELLSASLEKHNLVEGLDDRVRGILKILAEHIPKFPIPDGSVFINGILNNEK